MSTPNATPQPPDPPPATGRDLQREALNSLIHLVKQSAQTEEQIEREYAQTQASIAEQLQQGLAAAEKKYEDLEQAARDRAARRVMEAEKQFEWSRDDLNTKGKTRRARLAHEHDKIVEDAKAKLEQASWLADSVVEAAEIRIKEELKKAREIAAAHVRELDVVEESVKNTLISLGQSSPPSGRELPPLAEGLNLDAEFKKNLEDANQKLTQLQSLKMPKLVAGGKIWIFGALFIIAAILAPQVIQQSLTPQWGALGAMAAISIGIVVFAGVFLTASARKQIDQAFIPLRDDLEAGRQIVKAMELAADLKAQTDEETAANTGKTEIQKAKDTLSPLVDQSLKKRDAQTTAIRTEVARRLAEMEKLRDEARTKHQAREKAVLPKLGERGAKQIQSVRDRHDAAQFDAQVRHDKSRAELESNWSTGLQSLRQTFSEIGRVSADWTSDYWKTWIPPKQFAETVRFGEFEVDLKKILDTAAPGAKFTLPMPEAFKLPALLAFPRQSSLIIHTDAAGRPEALRGVQLVMLRLLTSLPAGRVRFTIIDPVSLGQNFGGFMHLTDFGDELVGARVWTSKEQVDQRLADLTEHMETVIQKYLRNEYETIDQYNAQAGELAEPYRFLVIADFPENFEAEALRRLASIASSGARCGVYTLIMRDTRLKIPSGSHFEDVESASVNLIRKEGRFLWKDEIFRQFPLLMDAPAPEEALTQILQSVGKGAKEAARIEVPFENITPKAAQLWSRNSATDLQVPVGRSGATRLQYVNLGRGVAQHALIAGKTGSGKSSFLNALITNAALWYPPDQVMLYLIDFKKGVEFKSYATHNLPHARAIAVESDREFGLSVLQRIDAELTVRGELYRKLGVQDLGAYRLTPDAKAMPRILLVIDEFQEFFSEDDKLSQEAGQLLDRLVRQGRAFGIHVFLGSQTLAGSSGLSRSTIGQMGVRVALQCTEADSQLILGDNNSAARLLSRPGEAIYNDAGGLVEGNSPFQVAWLPDEKRDEKLNLVLETARQRLGTWEPPIVFEGNSPAPIGKNVALTRLLEEKTFAKPPLAPAAWLGDPVAIKAPTAVLMRRQSGANVMMIGQNEEGSMAMMASVLVSLASQYSPSGAKFLVLDGTAVDSPLATVLPSVKAVLPHNVNIVDYRAVAEAIGEISTEMARRQAVEPTTAGASHGEEIFLLVNGVQRYRMLRKAEESFSFSAGDEEKKPDPGKQFADILRDGPSLGIHVVAWVDTPASIDRTLDRGSMREFDYRVLFQMSANDSSNLIDSPAANKLGTNRALVYSEEQGTMEKFRPYALPDKAWLEYVQSSFAAKQGGA